MCRAGWLLPGTAARRRRRRQRCRRPQEARQIYVSWLRSLRLFTVLGRVLERRFGPVNSSREWVSQHVAAGLKTCQSTTWTSLIALADLKARDCICESKGKEAR